MKISVIIPVYNESQFILHVLDRVNKQKVFFDLQIIVSDDCSTDGTIELLKKRTDLFDILLENKRNLGKGSAVSRAIPYAEGEITIIQDADLEYNPSDYKIILEPFFKNNADVVYGSRFLGSTKRRVFYFANRIANFLITLFVNIITNINFTDVETGYKAIKTDILKKINLTEKKFEFEIEITIKISRLNLRIFETGISYEGRTFEEGKKIRSIDAFRAIYAIIKYGLFRKK
jgi:glycosyltransferase involved in cell wall biosynthesis